MKLIQNKAYLTMQECVECGMSESYLRKAKSVGTRCWDFMDDPADRRRVLVGFEGMKDVYREKVVKRFGDVYEHLARTPILNMVNAVPNFREHEFFMKYRHSSKVGGAATIELSLPIDTVNKYTRADKWLQVLKQARRNKHFVKQELNLSLGDFYAQVGELLRLEIEKGKTKGYTGLDILPGDFPATTGRLLKKVDRYSANGPIEIIDGRFGNKNATKIGKVNGATNDEGKGKKSFDAERYNEQMAVIRTIASMHNNLDSSQVTKLANMVFAANGWETLSYDTIHKIITQNKHLLTAGRQGKRAWMNKIAMQVKRKAPKYPMQYWTLDGWTVELLYQEPAPKGVQYKRLVMVLVLDACGKYPVGYAIGDRENAALIREANRNALKHVWELLGAQYKPWQLQSDNYQVRNLTPFYQAVSHLHIPTAVGNAKAKVIEPYFMYLNKNYCQLLPNWSGFNADAKKDNQVNAEYLDKIKSTFPDRAGVVRQIERMIAQERAKKLDSYMDKWSKCAKRSKPEIMTGIDYLFIMGTPLGNKTNRLDGRGVLKQINGVEYTYDSFDPAFRAHRHVDWQLIGDENDMSRVLAVNADATLRFVLEQKRVLPMDVRSMNAADHRYLRKTQKFNQDRIREITNLYAADRKVTEEIIENTPLALGSADELALKAMFIHGGQQKEYIQDAKKLKPAKPVQPNAGNREWEAMQRQYLESKVDISVYREK